MQNVCRTCASFWPEIPQCWAHLSWGRRGQDDAQQLLVSSYRHCALVLRCIWHCTIHAYTSRCEYSCGKCKLRGRTSEFPWLERLNTRPHPQRNARIYFIFSSSIALCLCSGRFPVSAMFHTPAHSCNAAPNVNNNAFRIPLPVPFFMRLHSKVMCNLFCVFVQSPHVTVKRKCT